MRPIAYAGYANRLPWGRYAKPPRFSAVIPQDEAEQRLLAQLVESRKHLKAEGKKGVKAQHTFDTAVTDLLALHRRYIGGMERRYRQLGIDPDLLESAVGEGVIQAARQYDPETEPRPFRDFLMRCIRNIICQDIAGSRILSLASKAKQYDRFAQQMAMQLGRRPSREELETAWLEKDAKDRIAQSLEKQQGIPPTPDAVAAELEKNPAWLARAKRTLLRIHESRNRPVMSLNQPMPGGEKDYAGIVPARPEMDCHGDPGVQQSLEAVLKLWLNPLQINVLQLAAAGNSLKEIAQALDISDEQARQLKRYATSRLQARFRNRKPPAVLVPILERIRQRQEKQTASAHGKKRPKQVSLSDVPQPIRDLLKTDKPGLKQLVAQLEPLQRRFLELRLGLDDGKAPMNKTDCQKQYPPLLGYRIGRFEALAFRNLLKEMGTPLYRYGGFADKR